jgi:hypothetical protein
MRMNWIRPRSETIGRDTLPASRSSSGHRRHSSCHLSFLVWTCKGAGRLFLLMGLLHGILGLLNPRRRPFVERGLGWHLTAAPGEVKNGHCDRKQQTSRNGGQGLAVCRHGDLEVRRKTKHWLSINSSVQRGSGIPPAFFCWCGHPAVDFLLVRVNHAPRRSSLQCLEGAVAIKTSAPCLRYCQHTRGRVK